MIASLFKQVFHKKEKSLAAQVRVKYFKRDSLHVISLFTRIDFDWNTRCERGVQKTLGKKFVVHTQKKWIRLN